MRTASFGRIAGDFKAAGYSIKDAKMRGPDGTHYELAKDFIEVAEPERIVYQNLQQGHRFQMTMIFTDRAGQTELTWRMLFDPDSDYDKVKALVAEANEQNFDRLESHLANTP